MFYKTGVNISKPKSMFQFIKEHFRYYTMSSWNRLQSIANDVKIYNLNLSGDQWKAYDALVHDDYVSVNSMIEDWETSHPGYKVGFNGRSGGYLVLYETGSNASIVPDSIENSDTYKEWKQNLKDSGEYVKDNISILIDTTKIIRDFDILCDEIRDYVDELSK